ncbi:sensor histidine kinase [Pararhizobium sp. PWRC1-1]|uniref:sensor histidine kinase n=1 Tax=Pararhizobium sp. PWRC1-1 TaxID=2804566 RepID=UPI003CF03135
MESITRFYPRIVWIALVSLESDDTSASPGGTVIRPLLEVPDGENQDLSPLANEIARQRPGKISVYQGRNGRYLLAKRAPAPSNAAVVLAIDARLLLEPEERPAWARLRLILDGQALLDVPAVDAGDARLPYIAEPHFESVIDGESQRLSLTLDRPVSLADFLPVKQLLGFAAVSGLALFVMMFALRQRAVTMESQRTIQKVEARALLRERETLLAHASRVNAMGEMASGIAHELTQPLTAILSRSQAALRLASADKPDIRPISEALEINVREAKRAGEMLKRMRDYASNRAPKPVTSSINAIVTETVALTAADLRQRGISLECGLAPEPVQALVDAIELEQVLHNLIRNAADALEGAGAKAALIRIETEAVNGEVQIVVGDNGPGITPDALQKLFHPFFTTKPEGMGLGLSLCATLVERVDGRIEAANIPGSGASFTIFLPEAQAQDTA